MNFTRTGVFATPEEAKEVKDAWRPGVFMGGPLGHSTGADKAMQMAHELALKYGLKDIKGQRYGLDLTNGEFIAR